MRWLPLAINQDVLLNIHTEGALSVSQHVPPVTLCKKGGLQNEPRRIPFEAQVWSSVFIHIFCKDNNLYCTWRLTSGCLKMLILQLRVSLNHLKKQINFTSFWMVWIVCHLMRYLTNGLEQNQRPDPSLPFSGLCLLAVVLMYLMWILVLDTLEQFAQQQRVSGCPSYHLSIHHGPSFLMAPVAVFFCLLAGLLFILGGQTAQGIQLEKRDMIPELPMSDVWLFLDKVTTEPRMEIVLETKTTAD